MPKKEQIPDFLVEKYGTDSAEEIKNAKQSSERIDSQTFETVEVSKALSSVEFKNRLKELGIEYRKELESRQAVFTISTEDVDRDGDIVRGNGIDTVDYQKNPVVLFAHDRHSLPIGLSLKLYKSSGQTKAIVMFFDDTIDKTGTSDTIFSFVKTGGIKGASIGFRPIKARFPDSKELETLGMGPYGVLYEKVSLLEWSVCAIPSNQNSLRSKGLSDASIKNLKEIGLVTVEKQEDKVELNLEDVIDDVVPDTKSADDTIIILTSIKESIDELSVNIKGLVEKLGSVPQGTEQPEEKFDGILDDLQDAINRVNQ